MKINVHAGHNPDGKIACGAVGIIKESTQARKVVKYVKKYLKTAGHTVYDCTCNNGTSQSDVLNKIVKKCNAHKADLDISIHFNSGAGDRKGNGKSTGTEVLIYKIGAEPEKVAESITKEIAKLGFTNRGVKARPDLYVLNSTKAPAMLIECCFVDDVDDVKIYSAKKMAQAIVIGILNSYGAKTYKAGRNIRAFNAKGKKVGTVKKNTVCNIDKYAFINGYLMGRRKVKGTWVKVRYLKLK